MVYRWDTVPTLPLVCSNIFPINTVIMGLGFSVISHVQRPVHQTWRTEIVNKILHLWVRVMSHHGEASVKHDRKVSDFCPIITQLTINKITKAKDVVGLLC